MARDGVNCFMASREKKKSGPPQIPNRFLHKYLFAEVALDKRAYRVIEVVASSREEAESRLKTSLATTFIAQKPVRSAKRGVKSRLYRTYDDWANFLDKFFLTPKQIEKNLFLPRSII